MKLVLIALAIFVAKPDEPVYIPRWATGECVETIQKIVQHEVGNMDSEAWSFVADQVIYDIQRMGCKSLTQWRWAIGNYHAKNISPSVSREVWNTVFSKRAHPKCQFVGNRNDIPVWRSHGYHISVDYRHDYGKFTLIGVNCG